MTGQINFNLDSVDDPVLPDGIPSFEGGQFSNVRGNLLQPNQSKVLGNCDVDKLGKLRTRRGTEMVGTDTPAGVANKIVQGLTSYQTPTANYIVAAHNGKIWKYTGAGATGWEQIALGGVRDNAEMLIYRNGKIDHVYDPGPPVLPAGYQVGDTVLKVKEVGYVGTTAPVAGGARVEIGEKLYFSSNLRTDWYEYTIASVTPDVGAGGPVTQITLEEPGLVFDVKDAAKFIVARPALINGAQVGGYTGTLNIDGYVGVANPNELFVIKTENKQHKITTATGTPTTAITAWTNNPGSGSLQSDFLADSADVRVVFAQGNDKLYFSDGTGPIYAWDGASLMNISQSSTLDYATGSVLHQDRTKPPQDVGILLWFQNRLIASGIPSEPDAIYFSDYFDGTSWDRDYQKVRIGGGESDPITGLLAWTDFNMLVYKKNSCYIINLDPTQNANPDDPTLLVASFAVKQLHKLIGCPAPLSAVQVGGGSTTPGSDVFFVDGDKKVHSIRRVMAAETQQEVGQAMSLPIQDVLDTINLDHIDVSNAMYHNEHYILGLPSMRGAGFGALPNATVAYNLLTQSWCGVWSWGPTCFARRTDLGSYSRLILGDTNGYVRQWLDDISLDEETSSSYVDSYGGVDHQIVTQIVTRAITFGDLYNFKTGLSVEFEFDESTAGAVSIQVILDGVVQNFPPLRVLLAQSHDNPSGTFTTLTEPPLRLPFTLPVTLPRSPGLMRKAFDLQRYGTWRELQFRITTVADSNGDYGKLALRSIRVTGFMDTIRLQTIPNTGILDSAGDVIIPGVDGP